MEEKAFRSGFIALFGRPNVGKSSLVNALVGRKVAIVSPKPQTTRRRVQAVLTLPEAQIVFLDTPGIQRGRDLLGRALVRAAREAVEGIDAALLVVDAARARGEEDRAAAGLLAGAPVPTLLVVNKIDLVSGAGEEIALSAFPARAVARSSRTMSEGRVRCGRAGPRGEGRRVGLGMYPAYPARAGASTGNGPGTRRAARRRLSCKVFRQRPTLPPGPPGSTIGAGGLNFRVRDGTGCFPSAMATETSVVPGTGRWWGCDPEQSSEPDGERERSQVLGLLVPVG